jgi:hypothetical protein
MSDDRAARAVVWTVVVIVVAALALSAWLGKVVINLVLGGG